jgi:glycosyltransferase involved in cell wall biosynthesis
MAVPLVSVLLPAYNAAATLTEALESLQVQTLDDFEVVAVDDGSSDRTGDLLEGWRSRDPRLRPVRLEHQGLVGALACGLRECRGRYVARMDADDLAHPQRLAEQVLLLESRPEISVVGSLVETFPRQSVGQGFLLYEEWLNHLVTDADIRREIFIESPIPHPSAMVRRQEILDLGGYQERGWPEDYDLWLRYAAADRVFAKVPRVLLYWREHPSRLTRTDGRYSVENFLRAKAHYLLHGPLRQRDAVFVWGAGKTGRRLSKHLLRGGCPLAAFVDVDPDKIGGRLRGIAVVGAADLPALWRQARRPLLLAAVSSRGARSLIRQELARQGLVEGEDYWCAA